MNVSTVASCPIEWPGTVPCSGNGECINGKCICFSGWMHQEDYFRHPDCRMHYGTMLSFFIFLLLLMVIVWILTFLKLIAIIRSHLYTPIKRAYHDMSKLGEESMTHAEIQEKRKTSADERKKVSSLERVPEKKRKSSQVAPLSLSATSGPTSNLSDAVSPPPVRTIDDAASHDQPTTAIATSAHVDIQPHVIAITTAPSQPTSDIKPQRGSDIISGKGYVHGINGYAQPGITWEMIRELCTSPIFRQLLWTLLQTTSVMMVALLRITTQRRIMYDPLMDILAGIANISVYMVFVHGLQTWSRLSNALSVLQGVSRTSLALHSSRLRLIRITIYTFAMIATCMITGPSLILHVRLEEDETTHIFRIVTQMIYAVSAVAIAGLTIYCWSDNWLCISLLKQGMDTLSPERQQARQALVKKFRRVLIIVIQSGIISTLMCMCVAFIPYFLTLSIYAWLGAFINGGIASIALTPLINTSRMPKK